MHTRQLLSRACLFVLLAMACGTEAETELEQSRDDGVVPSEAIPQPFPPTVYFLYGAHLAPGETTIIDNLLRGGIPLTDVWTPHEFGPCAMMIMDQMIIRLKYPDPRVQAFGFVSDSRWAAPGICIPKWKHYRFGK